MINQKVKRNNKNQKGFTLLFAVLAATLVLAVGAAIISIAVRQVLLSGTGRDSQYAFYAANTGIECTLYWDLQASSTNPDSYVFATSSLTIIDSGYGAECVGINLSQEISNTSFDPENGDYYGVTDVDAVSATTHYRLEFTNDDGYFNDTDRPNPDYCADVEVRKYRQDDLNLRDIDGNPIERIFTTIISQGYNTCDEDNPRRIQRGLDLTY